MASRSKPSIFWIGDQQFTFNGLVDAAKKRHEENRGDFWPRVALVLLRRIFDLEKEKQQLAQGELFAPPLLQKKKDVTHER